MIRGQLCLYATKPDEHDWTVAGGVGIVEAPQGSLKPEHILTFVGMCFDTSHLLAASSYSSRPVPDHGSEMADHVRNAQWSRPVPGSGLPGGGMMFRRTRVPARTDHEIMSLAICLYAPAKTVTSQVMYSLTGVLDPNGIPSRMSLHSPTTCEPLAENGIGMAALLKRPVWGWSDEPFALQSTLRLDVIDDAMETIRLLDRDDRTPTDDARLETLKRSEGYHVVAGNRTGRHSAEFAEYRRLMHDVLEDDDWSQPITAARLEERQRRSDAAIREILRKAA